MNMCAKQITILTIAALMAGCNQKETKVNSLSDEGTQTNETSSLKDIEKTETTSSKERNDDKVIVEINREKLTYKDIQQDIELRIAMLKIRAPKINKQVIDKARKDLLRGAPRHFVQVVISKYYVLDNGIQIDDNLRAAQEKEIAKSFRQPNVDALKKHLSPEQVALFEKNLEDELYIVAAKKHIIEEANIDIGDDLVRANLDRISRMNEIAIATNKIAWANASNVWQKIESKTITFEEAQEDYNEAPNDDMRGGWATVRLVDLTDEPALRKALVKMKKGEYTPPIECDNGICIVKLESTRSANNPDDQNDEEPEDAEIDDDPLLEYDLKRIFFRLAQEWEVPEFEEARRGIKEAAENKALVAKFAELSRKYNIIEAQKEE